MNSGIHVFIYSATLAKTASCPLLLTDRERHCCTLGPQLKLFSISGSPAFRGGQYDRAYLIKSKQKVLVGDSWKDCKGEDSVGMYLFDLLPFIHPWPFSTMWHNSQKGSSHLARRKTKSQVKDSRAREQEPEIYWQQRDIAGLSPYFLCCDKKNPLFGKHFSQVSVTINSLPDLATFSSTSP